jgi:hypothetical protein
MAAKQPEQNLLLVIAPNNEVEKTSYKYLLAVQVYKKNGRVSTPVIVD